jgi:hypothetical protein
MRLEVNIWRHVHSLHSVLLIYGGLLDKRKKNRDGIVRYTITSKTKYGLCSICQTIPMICVFSCCNILSSSAIIS